MALENSIDVNSVTPQEVLLRLRLIFHLIFVILSSETTLTWPWLSSDLKLKPLEIPLLPEEHIDISEQQLFLSFRINYFSSCLKMKYFSFSDGGGIFPFIQ